MDSNLIKMFGVALKESNTLDFSSTNLYAMQRGYLVHPDVCNQSVMDFLEGETMNPNSTFYKDWEDIINRDRMEIAIDQILHYFTTYGTNFNLGNGYVPNDEPEVIPYKDFKVITPITPKELYDKCYNILTAGVALKHNTMQSLVEYIHDYLSEEERKTFDVDAIKNREAVVYICKLFGITPKDKFNLLRYIMLTVIGKGEIIQSSETINLIKRASGKFDFTSLNEYQLNGLSSIFLRFKNIFLAFKQCPKNAPVINKLRRLAVKNHIPLKKNILNNILDTSISIDDIKEALHQANAFKLVSLLQFLKERFIERDGDDRMYFIRNQKMFIKKQTVTTNSDEFNRIVTLICITHTELVNRLKSKACIVKYPKGVKITAPSSEKNFVGNYPFGTSYTMSNHNYIGIYWKAEWGTRDFDLSMIDLNGHKIGWNSNWRNSQINVIFSGDMTNAEPEASEVLYMKNGCPDGMIYVNRYSGVDGSKYKLYVGREDITNLKKNYMVDPNSIELCVDCESSMTQQTLGFVFDGTLTLMTAGSGKSIVSLKNDGALDILKRKSKCFVDLKELLEEAGFRESQKIIDENGNEVEETPVIDFTNMDKETLIKLFS